MLSDAAYLREALRLARRAYGCTAPNPMVGAVLVRDNEVIGRGWHRRAGQPHAEVEALRDATERGHEVRGATLFVTLEPCSTHGRTPPCTEAIIRAGIARVVAGATDPNPRHAGRGLELLRQAGISVQSEVPRVDCTSLNESFNHWIVHRTPWVIVKAAMTLDGKIATASGESKWITGERSRAEGMRLRSGVDAILVGVNTIVADDPALTLRGVWAKRRGKRPLRRIILDPAARTPTTAKVVSDAAAVNTTVVVADSAPSDRVAALKKLVSILLVPITQKGFDFAALWQRLEAECITSLLVEGGGETQARFLSGGLAHRVVFFYAPKLLGGKTARRAVAGEGAQNWEEIVRLSKPHWRRLGPDLMLSAVVDH
jgi:diaminohydroxyphosphoribosylaminopyrimidine deaminase/5-amino-6-(5-phosphoribosylamino)uracil reductase